MSKLKTKDAVLKVLQELPSKYKLAQVLGRRPIMVDNWLNNTRMGGATADRFEDIFGIEITDAYRPGGTKNATIPASD